MKKNLAIIGASYLQLPLIEKAKEMGYITHVFAWAVNDVGETAADFFYPISIVEKDKILEKCREIGICGICSIASDLAAITVNYVAMALGLNGNSLESTYVSTNKHAMRQVFEQNGDPSPRSILVDGIENLSEISLHFPVIVKPTDRSGSRGIFQANTVCEAAQAVQAAIAESFEKRALIEEYVFGQEYSVEYISFHGVHHFLAVTLKHTTGAPHFIETGHMEPAPLPSTMINRIQHVVEHALNSLGIRNGASHTEIKIDQGKIKIIEVGSRMGGDCIGSHLVHLSTGIDFVKCVVQVACNEAPSLSRDCAPQAVECIFILTQNDLLRFYRLQRENPESIITVVDFHPERIGMTTDSSNRAGCYIVKAS